MLGIKETSPFCPTDLINLYWCRHNTLLITSEANTTAFLILADFNSNEF